MASPAEAAAQRLSWEMESWKSIEIRTHQDFTNHDVGRDPQMDAAARFEDHYIETATGQRLYESSARPAGGDARQSTYYSDGTRCADLVDFDVNGARQHQMTIKRSFGSEAQRNTSFRPEPLNHLYIGTTPLPKALPKATHLGSDRHLDRDCDTFLFPGDRPGAAPAAIVYCLDRETSIPLEVRYFGDERSREDDRPYAIWRAESLDQVEGHRIPLKSEILHYAQDQRGGTPATGQASHVSMTHKILVDELHFQRDYPAALFWPVVPPGTWVIDRIAQKDYTTGLPRVSGPLPGSVRAGEGTPVRAEPPAGWTSTLSAVGLGLGLVLLIAGLMLGWWRRP
ncbi:MAG TPA: hypothetical protein VF590_21080 [Isosphaeraceae bacterium]|jgi:hypothetical protein